MTEIAATPSTAWNVIKTAHPGDVVRLGPGTYTTLSFYLVAFPEPGIHVIGGPGVIATAITLNSCEGFTVSDVEVIPVAGFTGWMVNVGSSKRCHFNRMNCHGGGNGIMLRYSHDVSAVGCEVSHCGLGIAAIDTDGFTLTGNSAHDLAADGFNTFGAKNGVIEGNHVSNISVATGNHGDAFQFASSSASGRCANLTFRSNTYERGAGQYVQGIFGGNVDGLVIADNLILGAMQNGVSVSDCTDVEISNNLVQPYPDMASWTTVRGASQRVKVTGQWTTGVSNVTDTVGPNVDVTVSGTHIVTALPPGDETQVNAWRGNQPSPCAACEAEIVTLKAAITSAIDILSAALGTKP